MIGGDGRYHGNRPPAKQLRTAGRQLCDHMEHHACLVRGSPLLVQSVTLYVQTIHSRIRRSESTQMIAMNALIHTGDR